jgi:hypothetical protein
LLALLPQSTPTGVYPMNSITDSYGAVWEFNSDNNIGLPDLSGLLLINGTADIGLFEISFVLYLNHILYAFTKDQVWYQRASANVNWTPASDPRLGAPSFAALRGGLS